MQSGERCFSSWVARKWLWILIPALLLLLISFLMPGPFYFWTVSGFRTLFHDNLSIGYAWATVLALVCAFGYALAFPLALRWLFIGSRSAIDRLKAFACIMVVFGSTPLLHALFDSNFKQTSGETQKWYVLSPSGEIILSDSGGFDPVIGVKKQALTPEVARTIERYKRGLRPKPLLVDPNRLTFFDVANGRPLVWYYKTSKGGYDLFDSEGFYPDNGELLQPVTAAIVTELKLRNEAEELRAQAESAAAKTLSDARAAETKAREEAQAREMARQQLMTLFGAASYPMGVVIVGARARQLNDVPAALAANQVVANIMSGLRSKGIAADELRTQVYATSHYDALMRGEPEILADVGLKQTIRAAVIALVDVACRKTVSLSDLISCTVSMDVRILKPNVNDARMRKLSETVAGPGQDDAIARAAELLVIRHPDVFEGA